MSQGLPSDLTQSHCLPTSVTTCDGATASSTECTYSPLGWGSPRPSYWLAKEACLTSVHSPPETVHSSCIHKPQACSQPLPARTSSGSQLRTQVLSCSTRSKTVQDSQSPGATRPGVSCGSPGGVQPGHLETRRWQSCRRSDVNVSASPSSCV